MKALVKRWFRKTLGAPALWLGFGAVLVVAGLAGSYHRAQVDADYALAMRVGPPEAVAIELANPSTGGEVSVEAMFDPATAVTVKIGAPGERVERLAVPLFPVASAEAETPPEASDLRIMKEAAGLVILPLDGLSRLLGENSDAVFRGVLNGPTVSVSAFALDTAAVLSETGVTLPAEFVAVSPWLPGRAEALAPATPSQLPGYLIWAGIAVIAFAFGLSMRFEDDETKGHLLDVAPPKMREKIVTKSRIMADTDRFNPLVGQDDIRRGAMERLAATERAQGRTPSTFFTSGPANKVGGGWVKSRR